MEGALGTAEQPAPEVQIECFLDGVLLRPRQRLSFGVFLRNQPFKKTSQTHYFVYLTTFYVGF